MVTVEGRGVMREVENVIRDCTKCSWRGRMGLEVFFLLLQEFKPLAVRSFVSFFSFLSSLFFVWCAVL